MSGHDGRKMRELLLIGEVQCGKSTTFNAICDGREISPRGGGLKTTGCRISAHPIPADAEEYAELTWKTDDELMLTMYDIVSDNLVDGRGGRSIFPYARPEKLPLLSDERVRALAKKAIRAEWKKYRGNIAGYDAYNTGRLDRLQIATLILEFYGTLMLGELRERTRIGIDDVQSFAVFPHDWAVKWQKSGEEAHWRLKDVAFAFLSGVDCHVHSPTLERLGCVVTECPGFFAGSSWCIDATVQAMLKADAILYLIGGQKQMTEADLRVLSEIRKTQQAHKLFFAINARSAKSNIERNIRPVDLSMIQGKGIAVESAEEICVFNALLAFNARTIPSDQEEGWEWKKTVGWTLSQYLDLDPFDNKMRIRDFLEKPMELYRISGLETVLDGLFDGMVAATRVPGRHLEIALIGEYQNGKSTIFNAMLDGRDLSPRGVNAKRSACTITACALSRDQEEYAEFEWRSDAMLDEIVATSSASDGVGGEDVARLAKLISRFRNAPELARLRKRRKMPIEEARSFLVYPVDWESRWQQDGNGGAFEFAQIAWVFIGRVKYHVHSKVLDRLDCDLTDSPGFGDGEWDETLARAAILRADVLVCVLDKSKSMTSESPYIKRLQWIKDVRKDNSVVYALNAETSRENAGEWRKTNVSTIRQKGIGVEEWQMPAFNAELGRYAAKMRSANGDVSLKSVLNNACHIMETWRGGGSHGDEDHAMVKDLCRDSRRMSREAGFTGFLDAVQRAVSDFREKEGNGQVRLSPIMIQEDGTPILMNGFVWNDDSSFVSRLMKGAKWKEGIPHCTCPHVISSDKERDWRPEFGYTWVDETSLITKWQKGVKWKAGLKHPDYPHVVSSSKEETWIIADSGYVWANDEPGDFSVKWKPGLTRSDCPNVVSSEMVDEWKPLPGYAWVDERSWITKWQKGVKWKAGVFHPNCPNVVSSTEADTWKPAPGYIWVDERSWKTKWKKGVKWKSGLAHPDVPHIESSSAEGYWIPELGYGWRSQKGNRRRRTADVREGCKWLEYENHPYIPHVYASCTEGEWLTQPGYVFVKFGRGTSVTWSARYLFDAVKWQPGYKRYDGKVAGDVEGSWENPIWHWLTH